jgi:hypothetical protein
LTAEAAAVVQEQQHFLHWQQRTLQHFQRNGIFLTSCSLSSPPPAGRMVVVVWSYDALTAFALPLLLLLQLFDSWLPPSRCLLTYGLGPENAAADVNEADFKAAASHQHQFPFVNFLHFVLLLS